MCTANSWKSSAYSKIRTFTIRKQYLFHLALALWPFSLYYRWLFAKYRWHMYCTVMLRYQDRRPAQDGAQVCTYKVRNHAMTWLKEAKSVEYDSCHARPSHIAIQHFYDFAKSQMIIKKNARIHVYIYLFYIISGHWCKSPVNTWPFLTINQTKVYWSFAFNLLKRISKCK